MVETTINKSSERFIQSLYSMNDVCDGFECSFPLTLIGVFDMIVWIQDWNQSLSIIIRHEG